MNPAPKKKESAVMTHLYNVVVTALAASVVSMVGFWLVEGKKFVVQEEVARIVNERVDKASKDNPYIPERNQLLDGLKKIDKINDTVTGIQLDVTSIKAKLDNKTSMKAQ